MSMFKDKRQSVTRLLASMTFAATLAACGSTSQGPTSAQIAAPVTKSADFYLANAQGTSGSVYADWQVLALKAMLKDGQLDAAQQQLDLVSRLSLTPIQMAEWQLASAEFYYRQGNTDAALDSLKFQPWWELDPQQFQRYHQMRVRMAAEMGDTLTELRSRVDLDEYLTPDQKNINWNALWDSIAAMTPEELNTITLAEDESVLRGWLELRALQIRFGRQPAVFQEEVALWLQQNPGHPANNYLPVKLQELSEMELADISNVAVILPLTGSYAKQGAAVRDGFFAAMLDDANRDIDYEVTVYDSTAQSMPQLVETLYNQGVDYVVGPLIKDNIEAFQLSNTMGIPNLALNLPDDIPVSALSCYFTLSPENEAEQAAIRLYNEGYGFPLVLAPDSEFGRRASDAFDRQWAELTAFHSGQAYYRERNELRQVINRAMGLSGSQRRAAEVSDVTNTDVNFQPRTRRDIDAIYMISTHPEISLLKPYIEVTVRPGVQPPPMFTSSRSNLVAIRPDDIVEMRGVQFSDIPLLISDPNRMMPRINSLWPNANTSITRLLALGMDAYLLTQELPEMQVSSDYKVTGQTGVLNVGDQCIINRGIEWAEVTDEGIEPVR
uniref:penicillin-binding protein activator n=1 Tax=Thaumasiovibrio occultus TaxID=1891184 RepID=UPI000B354FD4|nr:penicillin-binding protein activator [Thaumasiovibrio occultus]